MKRIIITFAISLVSSTVFGLEIPGVINKDQSVKEVASGFKFTEGPAWSPQGYWVFSDLMGNRQYQWTPGTKVRVFNKSSRYSNGNAFDKNGYLISARHDRTMVKRDNKGQEKVIASHFQGKKLNSPNDVTIHSNGAIYFTDPNFGIIGYGPSKAKEEQPVRGIYRIDQKGSIQLVASDLKLPNGLAFSPDESKLYVADSSDRNIYVYDVTKSSDLQQKKLFARQKPAKGQNPLADGIKADHMGNVFSAGPGGIWVFNSKGRKLGIIPVDAPHVSNLAFGGKDGRSLLITATDKVFVIETLTGIRNQQD
ncbi:MAG: SMP-30/gluconolactonase/LRE family protein [Pseudobacteriovorax sp.]|nr:SMP-30/gluconolactonase/LRE family protein [Pseudobacteriovorax sp.]